MKLTKLSLVAALLMGTSAFAIDNIKMSGNAKVYYSTTDASTTPSILAGNDSGTLFDKDSSAADIALNLNISADLAKNDLVTVSAGAGFTALTTLGLENNFVSNVWGGAHTATAGTNSEYLNDTTSNLGGAKVNNANWFNEAWVAVTAGKSTVKLGRMELDTPLAFTETWSIEKNTFEAAVLINQDIPDTTVVAAFVGNGNGSEIFGQNLASNTTTIPATLSAPSLSRGAVVNANGEFATYGENGAYALGIVNNSVEPLTVQAWYYDVSKLVQAYWLQADVNFEGILFGAQYSGHTLEKNSHTGTAVGLTEDTSSDVYALMLGYEMKDTVTAKVSYSQVGKDFAAGFNTATFNSATKNTAQSKLYTEAWWSYGQVTKADTSAMTLTVEAPVADIVDLGLYATMTDDASAADADMTEITLTASKSFGPLDTTLAYINTDKTYAASSSDTNDNMVQAYLTLNF